MTKYLYPMNKKGKFEGKGNANKRDQNRGYEESLVVDTSYDMQIIYTLYALEPSIPKLYI
jgi:hypothetical protein